MGPEFQPMRSLIYVDCVKEEYRHRLQNWLYHYHVPDSISQFAPYVSKYCFYNALPTPPEGERFGTIRQQLTEHYWMVNPFTEHFKNKALTEYFPCDVLKWQGNIPDDDLEVNFEGDEARSKGGHNGCAPFIFAFLPLCWEEDFKGKERTIENGPNYRWNFVMKYPEGTSMEEGDKWFYEKMIPAFQEMPEVTRILTSKVIQSINGCAFHRVVEMWFDGPNAWYQAAVVKAKNIEKPSWASVDAFPYLQATFEFDGIFLTDYAASDNMSQYRGYLAMR
ncbi:acetyl-CoA hydrolase [Parasporobacterium paucivorans]|uniref:Chalcone isomerase N-terminal domain-containing protein n=1 Tax=Parasporobacterium paucivorans DSM 15970 TaxID=1122934 RepID=A0A1M6FBV8_9FIRM|nr:acetyl-CoA hydrolase [Parasporobacterium paucivorans]SHI95126.1 hypothetical protein SAMN02745691_01102 [Parasporobacterium paucivorans DSM 15970]